MSNFGEKNRAFRFGIFRLAAILISCGIFVWLAETVRHQRNLPWDTAILKFLQSPATHGANKVMSLIARSGGIDEIVIVAVVAVLVLKHKRRMRDAFFVTLAIVGMVVINLMVRTVIQRPQLIDGESYAPTFEFGFPSSQAADTFAIAFVFAVLAWATQWRWTVITLGTLYVFALGISRAHLGLHYPSDILAGWMLALAWMLAASFVR
jgi:membrane-associated phospholipid phosphatase